MAGACSDDYVKSQDEARSSAWRQLFDNGRRLQRCCAKALRIPRAAKAAGVNVSTIKRWLKEPGFRAMVTTSPDIRAGAPGRMNGRGGSREPQRDERSRMWVAEAGERFEVLGYQIPPGAYDAAASVLHVHLVRPEARRSRRSVDR